MENLNYLTTSFRAYYLSTVLIALLVSGCYVEDPGPRQETEREQTVVDFDRLEMGSGFFIDVQQ